MADKTIKELADELGVSKQAIRKHLAKLPPTLSVTKTGRVYTLNPDIQEFVRTKVTLGTSKVTDNNNNNINTEISTFEHQIGYLEIQINTKDKQINKLHELLDQQQQLTLQANQQIKQLQEQLLLTTETKEEKEAAVEKTSSENESVSTKKWWAFWR